MHESACAQTSVFHLAQGGYHLHAQSTGTHFGVFVAGEPQHHLGRQLQQTNEAGRDVPEKRDQVLSQHTRIPRVHVLKQGSV